ncbi:hypothetical protein QTP88_010959 [Uroleucon formosanum]
MDESTDVSGLAVLLVFVRYKYQISLEEDLLLCHPLSTYTTGYEIFNMLNNFFELEGLTWDNCIDIYTDGAKAMVGKTAGVVSRIKEIDGNIEDFDEIYGEIEQHLNEILSSLEKYFPES